MKIRELHLIRNGSEIAYTSLMVYNKAVIFIEYQVKDVLLIYHDSVSAANQVDEYTIAGLEQLSAKAEYLQSHDRDTMVVWKN